MKVCPVCKKPPPEPGLVACPEHHEPFVDDADLALRMTETDLERLAASVVHRLKQEDLERVASKVRDSFKKDDWESLANQVMRKLHVHDYEQLAKALLGTPRFWVVAAITIGFVSFLLYEIVGHYAKEEAKGLFFQEMTNQIKEQFQEPRISNIIVSVATTEATNLLTQQIKPAIDSFRDSVASLEPTNRQVFDVVAWVHFRLRCTNTAELAAYSSTPYAYLMPARNPREAGYGAGAAGFPLLSRDRPESTLSRESNGTNEYSCFLHFGMDVVAASFMGPFGKAVTLDGVNALSVRVKWLPFDAEILSGSARLIVNASLERDFTILPQRAFEPLILTNTPNYRDDFNIIATFGTNSLPENHGPQIR